jgi:hypothetical protein
MACRDRYNNHLKKGEKRAQHVAWSNEDELRIIEMKENEKRSWKDIAKCFTGRSSVACRNRYSSVLKKGEKRAYLAQVAWTNGDDLRIIEMREAE